MRGPYYDLAFKGRSGLQVWLGGLGLIWAVYYLLPHFASYVLMPFYGLPLIDALWDFDSPIGYLFWSCFDIAMLAAIIWFYGKYRKRPFLDLLTAAKHFRWKRFILASGVFLATMIVTEIYWIIMAGGFMDHVPTIQDFQTGTDEGGVAISYDPASFWFFLPITLIFIPLNAMLQEVVFRGYMDQGLARFGVPLPIVFIITAALFSVWHLGNYAAQFNTGWYLASMFIFGIFMSLMVYHDGGLEAAIGVHVINNLFYFIISGQADPDWPVTTLWLWSFAPTDALGIVYTIFTCGATYLALVYFPWGRQSAETD